MRRAGVSEDIVMIDSRRSQATAARWQDRFDRVILVAAASAVVGVALQTMAANGPVHAIGLVMAWLAWLGFAIDAVVMLSVSPRPALWARGHAFDLALVVLTCPLWPILLTRLLLLELLPALTVLEAAKLAKLAKVAYALRRHRGSATLGRVIAVIVLVAAASIAVFVLRN
jgi:voltage-gated potassium channel